MTAPSPNSFDPEQLANLLKMPEGSQPIAILCLGHVEEFYSRPMLELENWAEPGDLEDFISENYWSAQGAGEGPLPNTCAYYLLKNK